MFKFSVLIVTKRGDEYVFQNSHGIPLHHPSKLAQQKQNIFVKIFTTEKCITLKWI